MKIAYDVAMMVQLVAASQNANDELQRARNLLQEIHSHSDWTCREKDTIDDMMRECRKWILKLSENQSDFLGAIRQVERDLRDAEKSVSGLFGGVESMLGKILAIPVRDIVIGGTGLLGFLFPRSSGGSTTHTGSSGRGHGGGGGHSFGGGERRDSEGSGGGGHSFGSGRHDNGILDVSWPGIDLDNILSTIQPVSFKDLLI